MRNTTGNSKKKLSPECLSNPTDGTRILITIKAFTHDIVSCVSKCFFRFGVLFYLGVVGESWGVHPTVLRGYSCLYSGVIDLWQWSCVCESHEQRILTG